MLFNIYHKLPNIIKKINENSVSKYLNLNIIQESINSLIIDISKSNIFVRNLLLISNNDENQLNIILETSNSLCIDFFMYYSSRKIYKKIIDEIQIDTIIKNFQTYSKQLLKEYSKNSKNYKLFYKDFKEFKYRFHNTNQILSDTVKLLNI